MTTRTPLTKAQGIVLAAAFAPMLATGFFGGRGTFTNISRAYGNGTALGAVAAGEGATAVLALVLMGLTMLGQSSPRVIRLGLWALPAAASAMAATAAQSPGRIVIYALTPMGMCVSAEGMAFLARRIVVHQEGRDAEAEAKAAAVVRELAYQRAVAVNHPDAKIRAAAERTSWKLARKVGMGDRSLGLRLLEVQRERVTHGADAALAAMFGVPTNAVESLPVEPTEPPTEGAPPVIADQDETVVYTANQLGSDLHESSPAVPPVVPDSPAMESPDPAPVVDAAESAPTAAADPVGHAPRRPTGPVPEAARAPRPTRSPAQLLDEARQVTADWPDDALTGEAIRKAVRTSSANGRALRDALRAERSSDRPDGAAEAAA